MGSGLALRIEFSNWNRTKMDPFRSQHTVQSVRDMLNSRFALRPASETRPTLAKSHYLEHSFVYGGF